MRLKPAIKASMKHTVAGIFPTLLGIGIMAVGLWYGFLNSVLYVMERYGMQQIIESVMGSGQIEGLFFAWQIVIPAIVGGYLVHRIGRTALLLYFFDKQMRISPKWSGD